MLTHALSACVRTKQQQQPGKHRENRGRLQTHTAYTSSSSSSSSGHSSYSSLKQSQRLCIKHAWGQVRQYL